ncbi:3-keto-5-aminohexanoate cleavage protein [Sphingomonas sp. STIS6.2]|uniref:3-keto-5-aminohexanoate cleavage protein n=1 Tax=Sphingomonas sp. STIS6.2 TaxID=1379700 RepID=UPI0004DB851B|nr:3-keto-5-aminohexanoate cleavage protein [Sphingomonas sp. STIS6.2]
MIVQACLNGARPSDYHPDLPLTSNDMARQGAACIAAGAHELHFHPRGGDGRESLLAVDDTVRVMRTACPDTLIGVSTGAWIEGDEALTRQCIEGWQELPDYASVNLSEPDAPAIIETLHRIGVGVEAGLATVKDAERFVLLPDRHRVFRILIEIEEQNLPRAFDTADKIAATLANADVSIPLLLHGFDNTMWPFVKLARQRGWSTRVGLEDGKHLPNGKVAPDNAALVTAALAGHTD